MQGGAVWELLGWMLFNILLSTESLKTPLPLPPFPPTAPPSSCHDPALQGVGGGMVDTAGL